MKAPIELPVRVSEAAAAAFDMRDLYYVIFRHQWKILLIFLAGVLGAAGYYFANPPIYKSEAKILIRYIVEGKATTSAKDETQMKSPDAGGATIINSEIEILTSLDLAAQVADVVGPEKILAKLGGGNDRMSAARAIRHGLFVEIPLNSSVLLITFRHPDAAVVQPVLSQLADTYLKRHVEIHQGIGVLDDFFSRQADQMRARLSTTEAKLRMLKAEVQVINLDESKRASMDLMVKLLQDLLTAEAELAEHRALLGDPSPVIPVLTPATKAEAGVTAESSEQYRRACRDLATLPQRLADLHTLYTDKHPRVRQLRQQMAEAEQRKQELEAAYPSLVSLTPMIIPGDLPSESRRVAALEAKIKVLAGQLETARTNATLVLDAEPALNQLQRQKEVEDNGYRFYTASLEQARIDESLGIGKITNISVVQTPTPAVRVQADVLKSVLIILLLGCFGGFGLGFVSERFFNRTIKVPADVDRQVGLPLFVSVPDTNWSPGFRLPRWSRNGHAPAVVPVRDRELRAGAARPSSSPTSVLSPADLHLRLRPYFEGLRDRLITYFEVRAVDHKPKLVAVTCCHARAGVSTVAAGLAAALSETGDGNVLLVDMNVESGAAHAFHQGEPRCGLSEALEESTRDPACVQENLYMVSAHETNNQKLPRVLPKRFAHLVPRMKASDYDYIIFDMPPVTQTSITPRLAGFMDMVLVVIESERTGSEIVKRANALLQESRANVAAILNKHRAYVPSEFDQ